MDSVYCRDEAPDGSPAPGGRQHQQEPRVKAEAGEASSSSSSSVPVTSSSHHEYLMPPPPTPAAAATPGPAPGTPAPPQQHHQHLPSFSEMEAAARKHGLKPEDDDEQDLLSPSHHQHHQQTHPHHPQHHEDHQRASQLGLNLMIYPSPHQQNHYHPQQQQQHELEHEHEQQMLVEAGMGAGPDGRGRFSSGGSSDSSSSVRVGVVSSRGLPVLQSEGYNHDSVPMERPPSELTLMVGSSHVIMAPGSVQGGHHLDGYEYHHHHQVDPGHPDDSKPVYSQMTHLPQQHHAVSVGRGHLHPQHHHDQNQHPDSGGHGHGHVHGNLTDAKKAKREQARNYVKQKRLEIQQNDPIKYEQLKEKNRLRRREKLREIREDPTRYEEMKKKQRERVKEQRERIKQNPAAYEEMKRKQREREKARRREIMADPVSAAAWRERHRVMARERRLKRKIMYHLTDITRQVVGSPDIKFEPPSHQHHDEHQHSGEMDGDEDSQMDSEISESRHHLVRPPGEEATSSSMITPQQALSALIQSSEPIQEQINKYLSELKRGTVKRSDLTLDIKKKGRRSRSGGRGSGNRRAQSPEGFESMDAATAAGVLFKSASGLDLKMEDDWAHMASSNSDSQGPPSPDDFGAASSGLIGGHQGGQVSFGIPVSSGSEVMLFGAISPTPGSPGTVGMGPPSDLSLNSLGPRSNHHMHHQSNIQMVEETHLHHQVGLQPQPAHHHQPHPLHHSSHLYPSHQHQSMQSQEEALPSMDEHHFNHQQQDHHQSHHVHPSNGNDQYHQHHNHHHHPHHPHHHHLLAPPTPVTHHPHHHQMSPPRDGLMKGDMPPESPMMMDQRQHFGHSVSPETVVMDCSQQRINLRSQAIQGIEATSLYEYQQPPRGYHVIQERNEDNGEDFVSLSSTPGPMERESPIDRRPPSREPLPSMSNPVAVDMSYLSKI